MNTLNTIIVNKSFINDTSVRTLIKDENVLVVENTYISLILVNLK